MKVAFVSTYLPQRCGIATYTDYLVGGIRNVSDAEIKIVAEIGAGEVSEQRFKVRPCWRRSEDYQQAILEEVKDADIVHLQHEYSIYGFDSKLPSLLEKLSKRKVITIHCIRPCQFSERGDVDEKFAGKIASLADKVIVHLESQKAILERLGVEPEKIKVIPHGTEITNEGKEESREKLGLSGGKLLLMFGFVKPHKCMHITVSALKMIIDGGVDDAYIFVAGGLAPEAGVKEREYVDFVKGEIKKLGLEDKVIVPNKFFPNEFVPYIFGAADVVLFPYYEEDRSASGSLHLAIGAGKPVIASRIPKFEELKMICDELLVLPYNAEGIAKVILRLFKEPDFLKYIKRRTEEYRRATSWTSTAEKHIDVYRKVLGCV